MTHATLCDCACGGHACSALRHEAAMTETDTQMGTHKEGNR